MVDFWGLAESGLVDEEGLLFLQTPAASLLVVQNGAPPVIRSRLIKRSPLGLVVFTSLTLTI